MSQDPINHPYPLRLLFLLVIVLLVPVPGSSEAPPHLELSHLQVRDRRIVDDRGATVILRGVAVNQLGDYFQANPRVPSTMPLTRRDFERMAALGLDSVRLVVSWSLLEPEPGVHDEAYLARVKQAVDWARENGIYVILDMHQDAWGKYIGTAPDQQCRLPLSPNIGWDGAPEWATITDNKNRCMFIHREFSAAGFRAWQAFWEDRDGIQQHLIDTWAWLAAAFKDDPAVAGYDLLNEPNWGENYAAAVRKYKPAFYGRAVKAIRRAETGGLTKLIFFEPIAVWSALPGEKPVLFTDDPNLVYAPHIYLGSISVDVFLFHRELIPLRKGFEIAKKEADRYNTTFWNGEWLPGPGDHAWRYAALEDEYQIGSARWIWKSACGDPHQMAGIWPDRDTILKGTGHATIITRCGDPDFPAGADLGVNPIDAEILARPYPRAFPSPAVYTSDPKTRDFRISGTAPRAGIPLLVWFPGDDEPQVETVNVAGMQIEQVDGGWLLSAAPGAGEWSLHAAPAIPPCASKLEAGTESKSAAGPYLFSYFKDREVVVKQKGKRSSGGAGLHLAWSDDGLHWKKLNRGRVIMKPTVSPMMRDPFIRRGPDGTFHLVWTTGWGDVNLGYASSPDLIHWENERLIPVMEGEPEARNAWAPEIIHDDENDRFLIYWSTTIPGRFPDTDATGDNGYNHRIYFTTTTDFATFTPSRILYDPGFNCIDANIVKDGDEYVMFLKNETRHPPAKYLVMARSARAAGPYGDPSPPVTSPGRWVEGSSAALIDGQWFLYFDRFAEGRYGVLVSDDLTHWQDLSHQLKMPRGARHGDIFAVSDVELKRLLELPRTQAGEQASSILSTSSSISQGLVR